MTKTNLMDKYPVHSLEIQKNQTNMKNVDEIISYFQDKISKHPVAAFIAIFDHYSHTQALNGNINPDIQNAKNIVFCFGPALPSTKILAIRPRSIGVSELENSFMIDFMEAPREDIHELMKDWTVGIINK